MAKYYKNTFTAEDKLRLTEAMKKARADGVKTVNIVFFVDGVTASGKVNTMNVLLNVGCGDNFTASDFVSLQEGRHVLQVLNKKMIPCSNISYISYRGKVIYH